ncbi:tropomodulin-1 [Patella vulgata]|uniref:tropomodulin-1 n=1 Tax=Patella vulgata TaxID=6465 RepID=UPI0021803205|nr:tropomodulin-1 [Patella vulgata]
MALFKAKSEDVPDIDLDNLDDILALLTVEELEELNGDFDPDNSLLPPSQRQKDQTDKSPTGPYRRQKLLDFLEKKAKEEKDWEQNKPYVKETKGKVYVPKKVENAVNDKSASVNEDANTETEWDDILTQASEEELVDLAAVLGFHSMLTQTQYYASLEDRKISEGGFKGAAHSQSFSPVANEPPNTTDVEDSIARLKRNDPELTSLNLNNIKNIHN